MPSIHPDIYENHDTQAIKEVKESTATSYEVDKIVGNLVYLKGLDYPHKGLPTHEAVHAIGIVKKVILELLKRPLLFFRFKSVIRAFNTICWEVMSPYILKLQYQTQATLTIGTLVELFMTYLGFDYDEAKKTSDIISHVFEYDNAYRFRLQDIATETTTKALYSNPRVELKRLLELNRQRDYTVVSAKIGKVANVVLWLLLIPKYKKAFREAVRTMGIEGVYFDDNDRFWARMKTDYKYFGQTYEERTIQLQHGA